MTKEYAPDYEHTSASQDAWAEWFRQTGVERTNKIVGATGNLVRAERENYWNTYGIEVVAATRQSPLWNANGYDQALTNTLDRLRTRRASVAAPQVKAHYESAHPARYALTHAVHPDIVVLWFLALKSHWFEDENNAFFGKREEAKIYLYKWVETGELADADTTLEVCTGMKFREWLESSWATSPSVTPSTTQAGKVSAAPVLDEDQENQ